MTQEHNCPICKKAMEALEEEESPEKVLLHFFGVLWRLTNELLEKESAELAVQEQIRRNLQTMCDVVRQL